ITSALENFAGGRQRSLDVCGPDVEMGYRPDSPRTERPHSHAPLEKPCDCCRGIERASQLEQHDVRLYTVWCERNSRQMGEALGEAPRMNMVLREAFDMVFQTVDASGRNDAGLPHGTSHLLFESPSLRDEIACTRERCPDRRS